MNFHHVAFLIAGAGCVAKESWTAVVLLVIAASIVGIIEDS